METSTSEGGTNGASTSSPFRVGAAGSSPLWRVDTAPALSPITEMPSTEPPKVRRSWSSSSGSRGRGSGMLRAGSSRWKSRTKKKDPNAPSGSLPEEVAPLVSRRPVQFFKEKHILVEMNELRGTVWMETHRWNFGLEEDLGDDGHVESTRPHLPWISAFGLTQLATSMQADTIILDPPNVRTFTALVDVVAKAVAAHTNEEVADSARKVLGYQIWDHHIRIVPEHEHESKEEHDERAKYGYHKDEARQKRNRREHQDGHFERLIPEEAEESANILVGAVDWLHDDVVVIVRLENAIRVREMSNDDPTGEDNFPPTKIFAVILGPPRHGASCIRHVEMGEALAALLQDEDVLKGFYGAVSASDVLDVINVKMHKLTIMPQIVQPSKKAIKEKTELLREVLLDVAMTRYPKNQVDKWSRRAGAGLGTTYDANGVLTIMRKYAMPLVFGVILALILKNTDASWYDLALGPTHHSTYSSDPNATHSPIEESNITTWCEDLLADGTMSPTGSPTHAAHTATHVVVPTIFGFSFDGHEVNFYFIVNDVLMCFFFGLAAQEITESFIPGGMMYPIGKSVVNPLGATLGGVLGPVIMYFVLLFMFDGAGSFDDKEYSVDDLITGWGIPTATDIAICWAVAVVVFGAGHPAVKYLLLLAIVDDGIGLIIIAVAYPDPQKPMQAQWLGFVVLAMAMSYMFRRWKWKEWWLWVFLAGPVSWYGLIMSGLHPALALCFVVPFMPGAVHDDAEKKEGGGDGGGGDDDALDKSTASNDENKETGRAGHNSHSTLQNFEHAIKGFVDLIVLFSFGLASAGVDLSGFGPYTSVIVLSLVLGKTLGISLCAYVMVSLGFPFPAGMNMKCTCMVAFIASIGLTVALFVAGEAYPTDPVVAGEAKLGALCSIMVSVLAVGIGACLDLSPEPVEPPAEAEKRKGIAAGTGGEGGLLENDRKRTLSESSDDECLETVFAKNTLNRLSSITRSIKTVEKETHVSRQEAMSVFRKHANAIRDKVKIINALRGSTESTGPLSLTGVSKGRGSFLQGVIAQKATEDATEAAADPSLPAYAEVYPAENVIPIQARRASEASAQAAAVVNEIQTDTEGSPTQAAARQASRFDTKKKAAEAARIAAAAMQAAADAAAEVATSAEEGASQEDSPQDIEVVQVSTQIFVTESHV